MASSFLKIDIHTHIMPKEIPRWVQKFGYGGFIHLEHHKNCCAKMMIDDKFFREVESNCWDENVRMHECDMHKVHVQVLSTIPVLFHYWAKAEDALQTARFFNDHIAEVCHRHPTRFIGLGTLPMQDPQLAVGELERCVNELGLQGVEIGSHINDWNLSEKVLFPVYEAAERLGAAVFVHPWDMMGKEKMEKYWLPWLVGMPAETSRAICSMIFGGVFEQFPALKVAFAHGGGSFPATVSRIEHGFWVRPDLCAIDNTKPPKSYLGKFYIDSLVHDERILDYLIDLMGADRIALGSDYPFPLGEHEPGKLIENMPYSDHTKELLLSGSALHWLSLEKSKFI
ncbi:MAG: amidohydrolase family protein [Chitinophagales bacterium]|nr:amidohydrolase [Bacteroidota bacterium]MCB9043443.1 amidohydrolase [Chitinophagales bacterium]